jgi:EmrB/QacA subfamily drug resistance transporter
MVLLLSWAALTYALAQTTAIAAYSALERAFGADTSQVGWTTSSFLVAAAVATPIFGRLGDMFGKRRMLVLALALFGSGSVVCALAPSLEVVVAGRVLQGLGGGIFPLCFAILRDEVPAERRRAGIGIVSAMIGVGGGLGLLLGGALVDHVSWQAIFWFNAGLAAFSTVAAARWIPESPIRTPGRVDYLGGVVLALGLVPLLVALSRAGHWGWADPRTLGLVGAGLAVLVAWTRLESRRPSPMADMRLLREPPVLMTNLATLLLNFGMFGSYIAIPQLAQAQLGASPTEVGVLLLPGALVMLLAGPLSGWAGGRVGNKAPLVIGGLAAGAGLFLLGLEHGSREALVLCTLPMFAGIGLAFAAMPNLIVDAVPARQTGEATGMNNVVRTVGSALGGQLCATLIATNADASYTRTFLVSACVSVAGALVASLIPRASRAAAPVGAPAYADVPG